jgi:hypothetical protein
LEGLEYTEIVSLLFIYAADVRYKKTRRTKTFFQKPVKAWAQKQV